MNKVYCGYLSTFGIHRNSNKSMVRPLRARVIRIQYPVMSRHNIGNQQFYDDIPYKTPALF
jgi:hypothetical protein